MEARALESRRGCYILCFAVSEVRIDFTSVAKVEEFQSRLRELPGVEDWTAQYIAMRASVTPMHFRQVIWVCCASPH